MDLIKVIDNVIELTDNKIIFECDVRIPISDEIKFNSFNSVFPRDFFLDEKNLNYICNEMYLKLIESNEKIITFLDFCWCGNEFNETKIKYKNFILKIYECNKITKLYIYDKSYKINENEKVLFDTVPLIIMDFVFIEGKI